MKTFTAASSLIISCIMLLISTSTASAAFISHNENFFEDTITNLLWHTKLFRTGGRFDITIRSEEQLLDFLGLDQNPDLNGDAIPDTVVWRLAYDDELENLYGNYRYNPDWMMFEHKGVRGMTTRASGTTLAYRVLDDTEVPDLNEPGYYRGLLFYNYIQAKGTEVEESRAVWDEFVFIGYCPMVIGEYSLSVPNTVPEPATFLLFGLGLLGLAGTGRGKQWSSKGSPI